MKFQSNKPSNEVEAHPSKRNPKTSPILTTAGKVKDDVIFTKEKSPDDLEILE